MKKKAYNDMKKKSYNEPRLVEYGHVASLTGGGDTGSRLDDDFVSGDSRGDLTFS